jgi:glycine/D-amino acid oxidase-like deaminating enzyme
MSVLSQAPRVAVIGGGIFGVTAALQLSESCRVTLFERGGSLFQGATFANHNRHHFGFHYPRSPETAQQCLKSRADFSSLYAGAEIYDFPNYYCIGAQNSRVTPDQYLAFCRSVGLEFAEEHPPEGVLDDCKVALALRVREGICDFYALRDAALARLAATPSVEVLLRHRVLAGRMTGRGAKQLEFSGLNGVGHRDFDFVVSAVYAHTNTFCDWFGFARRNFQFNLQELNIIELPPGLRLGITVMDGVYPSFLPFGRTPYHILAHVEASQLVRESSFEATPLLSRISAIESNWSGVLETCSQFLPVLKRARYVKSLFVDRVVDAGSAASDARITELTDHGSGCYSIFAAKVITCVSTAKKLAHMIGEVA